MGVVMRFLAIRLKSKLLGFLVGAALGVVAGNAAHAANLILDGSFEDPTVGNASFTLFSTGSTFGSGNPWTVVGTPGGNVGIVDTNFSQNGILFVAQDANQWIDLTGVTQTPQEGVQQTVATTIGQQYSLSFYVGNVNNGTGIFGTTSTIDVSITGSPIFVATNSCTLCTTTLAWQLFTTTFTATSASTAIAFLNGDPTSDTSNGLDNISLNLANVGATPLPAALPLFATGLGAMGLLGWRRKRKGAAVAA